MDLGPPYRIETERLVLRCFEPRDAPMRKRAYDASFEALRGFFGIDAAPSLAEHVARIRKLRAEFDSDEELVYAVFPRDESAFLGEALLLSRAGYDAREVGYYLVDAARGKGYATEAAAALVHVGFSVLRLARIDLQHVDGNDASARIADKLGFVREGLLRARTVPSDRRPENTWMCSILKAEHEARRSQWPRVRAFDVLGGEIAMPTTTEPR